MVILPTPHSREKVGAPQQCRLALTNKGSGRVIVMRHRLVTGSVFLGEEICQNIKRCNKLFKVSLRSSKPIAGCLQCMWWESLEFNCARQHKLEAVCSVGGAWVLEGYTLSPKKRGVAQSSSADVECSPRGRVLQNRTVPV